MHIYLKCININSAKKNRKIHKNFFDNLLQLFQYKGEQKTKKKIFCKDTDLKYKFGLIDLYRVPFPTTPEYTFFQIHMKHLPK